MGLKQWMVALACVALFAFAILGFTINFANDNNSPVDISDDAQLSSLYTDIEANLSTLREQSHSTYTSILNTTLPTGSQAAQSSGPFSITIPTLVGTTINILWVGYYKIFGTGTGFGIFLSITVGLIVIISGLYIWKALFGGPD